MRRLVRKLGALLPAQPEDSRPAQRRAIVAGVTVAAAAVGQLVMGKAIRDAFFLANYDVRLLPRMMIVSAVLSFAAVLGVTRAMTRFTPFRVMPALFLSSGVLLFVHAFLSVQAPRLSAVMVYLHLAVFGSTTVSVFWSLINERYDPHSAKQVVGRFAGGATVGGLLAGLVAWQAATHLSIAALLVVMGALNLSCLAGLFGLRRPRTSRTAPRPRIAPADGAPLLVGIQVFKRTPYLRQLASLVAVAAVASALMDYFLGARVKGVYTSSADLLSFFALFQLGVALLSFLIVSTVSKPSLKTLGLAGTVALLPASLVLGGVAALAMPALWSALAMRAADAILHNSLFRSGYELLFTPIAPDRKRATKLIIDVAFDRIGTATGSGIAMIVVLVVPAHTERVIAAAVIGLAVLGLWISLRLHAGYVKALEQSLRDGAVRLDEADVVDATTWQTLTQTNLRLDRRRILMEIERLRKEPAGAGQSLEASASIGPVAPSDASDDEDEPAPPSLRDDPILRAVAGLRSHDVARIRALLSSSEPLAPELVAHVIPLLARADVRRETLHALRKAAPRSTGQLLDALLDPSTPTVVRRRLGRVLRTCPTQRVADGLVAALGDGSFEVRFQCGVSLWAITDAGVPIRVTAEAIFEAAQREVEVSREIWDAQASADVGEKEDAAIDEVLSHRRSRSLEHVFRLLALVLDRAPLMLALRALEGDDPRLRGTSLEYLENVLPERIRRGLWPYLNDRRTTPAPARPRQEIIDDLLRSGSSISAESLREPPTR